MDIWIISAEGGEARQLTFDENRDDQAAWSPDDTRIAFMSERSGKRDIWIIPVSGGVPIRFTDVSENAWSSWSPDGEKIAFSSKRTGNTDIWVKDVIRK